MIFCDDLSTMRSYRICWLFSARTAAFTSTLSSLLMGAWPRGWSLTPEASLNISFHKRPIWKNSDGNETLPIMDFKSIVKFEIGISKRKLSVFIKGYFKEQEGRRNGVCSPPPRTTKQNAERGFRAHNCYVQRLFSRLELVAHVIHEPHVFRYGNSFGGNLVLHH